MKSSRLLKTVTWSILAFTVTTIVAYLATGSLAVGSTIGLVARGIKIPLFYVHDALWSRVDPDALVASPEWPEAYDDGPGEYADHYHTWKRETESLDAWAKVAHIPAA